MGGWRCSYRNCTMRSDGKTHMFHYPVFDKVRCHQWLVNAGRLDFLNLKVSQLKNRVVCQHHFSDEQFMNFKRDKLTFDAVPCLDGPYCDVSEGENEDLIETSNSLSIIFDDIENEYMTLLDKRANYSVKYADFLTSNELDGIDISTIVPQQHNLSEIVLPRNECNDSKAFITPDIYERQEDKVSRDVFSHNVKPSRAKYSNVNYSSGSTPDLHKKYQTQPVLVVPPYKSKPNQNESQSEENILEIELPPGFINNNTLLRDDSKGINFDTVSSNADDKASVLPIDNIANNLDPNSSNVDTKPPEPFVSKPTKKPAKIKILSEETISEPLTVIGNLEPVSPSTILPIKQKKPYPPTIKPREISSEIITNNQELLLDTKPPLLEQTNKELNDKTPSKKDIKERKVNQDSKVKSPRVSLLKKKITPERIAAIEEKRKFNMKLRDIIESFLGKLDEQDKEIKETKDADVPNQVTKNEVRKSNVAKSHNAEERTIARLEARIKKMEDNLLNKIDQNSQRILELKNTIAQTKPKPKKSHATQTSFDHKCEKKRLYQEISQYLSPDANSLVYEELFINKYGKDVSKVPSAKRKRPR